MVLLTVASTHWQSTPKSKPSPLNSVSSWRFETPLFGADPGDLSSTVHLQSASETWYLGIKRSAQWTLCFPHWNDFLYLQALYLPVFFILYRCYVQEKNVYIMFLFNLDIFVSKKIWRLQMFVFALTWLVNSSSCLRLCTRLANNKIDTIFDLFQM